MIHLNIGSPALTSSIPNKFEISDVGDFATCRVYINNTLIYEATLTATNGSVFFYDLRQVVENHLLGKGYTSSYFLFEAECDDGSSYEIEVLGLVYAAIRHNFPTDADFLNKRFLSTRRCHTIPRGYLHNILYFTDADHDLEAVYDCRFMKGDTLISCTVCVPIQAPQGPDVYALQADSGYIWGLCNEELGEGPGTLLSASVKLENRTLTLYFNNEKPVVSFFFRNAFNAHEYAHIIGKDTLKTDISRKEAVCQGVSSFYDQSVEKKHQIETHALSLDEAQWLNELLTSRSIQLTEHVDNEDLEVIFSDISSEIVYCPNELTRFKFSWRMADKTDWRFYTEAPQIFNNTFNNTFQ